MITERIDPQNPTAFDEWHAAMTEATTAGREFGVAWSLEEMRIGVNRQTPYFERELWAVRDDGGRIAGVLYLDLPQKDNTSLVSVELAVVPERRRQGYGTALAQVLDERVARLGRTIVHTMVHSPLGAETAGQAFARGRGMTLGLSDVHRILELPLDQGFLEELATELAGHHRDYRLVTWQDRCPDDLVDAYAALETIFNEEAPMGELEMEAEAWDADRVRSREEQSRLQGRSGWVAAAVAPDGSLAGMTEMFVPTHDQVNAFQSGTLVAPAHRGHRLGLALKVLNHLQLQRSHPGPRVLHTWNAEQNTAMNAVNAALGYRPVELTEEWQRKI
jgi:GNAT superfamily N-acetyltransferase